MLLTEQLEEMACGDADARMTPALVFCFNRDECWTVAEQIKGKKVLSDGQQARLIEELDEHDWSQGAGTKLRQLLLRGVGVHHAGLLPKYRRIVELLFQRKLLSVAICTETLAAGINLPARSVVLPTILKGPPEKKRMLEPSAAHQIFGRAGRPQFDTQGHVYVLAHEDDVKIARWREQYDKIPEDTKDPGLMKAKKALKRKMPHRRDNEQYWNEAQFQKLVAAPPGKLHSRGPLPWRLLGYMLDASPEIDIIRRLVGKRLMDATHTWRRPSATWSGCSWCCTRPATCGWSRNHRREKRGSRGQGRREKEGPETRRHGEAETGARCFSSLSASPSPPRLRVLRRPLPRPPPYRPVLAHRYGGTAQAGPVPQRQSAVRHVSGQPVGHRRSQGADPGFRKRAGFPRAGGAATSACPSRSSCRRAPWPPCGSISSCCNSGWRRRRSWCRSPKRRKSHGSPAAATTPSRTKSPSGCSRWPKSCGGCSTTNTRAFSMSVPGPSGRRANCLLEFNGNFNKYVGSKDLLKQEGIVFRHLLRLILLMREFRPLNPPDLDAAAWRYDLDEVVDQLTASCRAVDPTSTDHVLEVRKNRSKRRRSSGPGSSNKTGLLAPLLTYSPASPGRRSKLIIRVMVDKIPDNRRSRPRGQASHRGSSRSHRCWSW